MVQANDLKIEYERLNMIS